MIYLSSNAVYAKCNAVYAKCNAVYAKCIFSFIFPSLGILSDQMSSTRFVYLATAEDVEKEKSHLLSFLSLATVGQKCRMIVEKRAPPEWSGITSPTVHGHCNHPPPGAYADTKLKEEIPRVSPQVMDKKEPIQ